MPVVSSLRRRATLQLAQAFRRADSAGATPLRVEGWRVLAVHHGSVLAGGGKEGERAECPWQSGPIRTGQSHGQGVCSAQPGVGCLGALPLTTMRRGPFSGKSTLRPLDQLISPGHPHQASPAGPPPQPLQEPPGTPWALVRPVFARDAPGFRLPLSAVIVQIALLSLNLTTRGVFCGPLLCAICRTPEVSGEWAMLAGRARTRQGRQRYSPLLSSVFKPGN